MALGSFSRPIGNCAIIGACIKMFHFPNSHILIIDVAMWWYVQLTEYAAGISVGNLEYCPPFFGKTNKK